MARLSFLWHLHQPSYRTADRVSHAPWTVLHAGGAYRTLAASILECGGRGQVINIVPTLLEQLLAYRDGTVRDPILEAIITPAAEVTDAQRDTLVAWGFHVSPRQMERYPRLKELESRRPSRSSQWRLSTIYGPGDLRDLQILFVLAQAGEQAWRDDRLSEIAERGRGFSPTDHEAVTAWLLAQPGELVELWQRLVGLPGVEIATSPYAHPIMPLLIDTGIVRESWAPHPAPEVPTFRHPEDASWQLEQGLSLMRANGLEATGCWPPEGSVSADALSVYAEAGVQWLVTDEGILEKSLGRPLRDNGRASAELYRPWALSDTGPTLYFRDRDLSDAIGFRYGRWDDEARAARSLVQDLRNLGKSLPDDAAIVLALDGENPWLHYPDGGGRFLRELMAVLDEDTGAIEPTTLGSLTASSQPDRLPTLHPGSWINSVFATWIGHPEKTAAWRLLTEVREALGRSGSPRPPSLLVAEASDWFWWLGDDNPTELAPLYDEIFRRHLADACSQAGIESPADLDRPIKTVTRRVTVPVSTRWQPPRMDGRITSYFEWCLAVRVNGDDEGPLPRLALWGGADRLHLLVEDDETIENVLTHEALSLRLTPDSGEEILLEIDSAGCDRSGVECAVGRVLEISLPWVGHSAARLEVRLGDRRLPRRAVMHLEAMPVDEPLTAAKKE